MKKNKKKKKKTKKTKNDSDENKNTFSDRAGRKRSRLPSRRRKKRWRFLRDG